MLKGGLIEDRLEDLMQAALLEFRFGMPLRAKCENFAVGSSGAGKRSN